MIIFFIFLFYWLGLSWSYSYIFFSLLGLIAFVFAIKKYNVKVGIICLSISLIGVGVKFSLDHFTQKTNTNYGIVIETKDNYFIFQSLEKYYVYNKDNQFEAGDVLNITGEISKIDFATVESGFDFNQYLNNKGIKHQLKIEKVKVIFRIPLRINAYKKSILSRLDDPGKQFVSSVLFGNSLDGEFNQNLEKIHLGRFTSLNGFYLYAYVSLLTYLLSYLIKKRWANFVAIFSLTPYLFLTIGKFTPFRVFIFMLARHINKHFLNNKYDQLTITGFLGLIFLFLDPNLARQLSFYVAFLSILWQGFLNETNRYKGFKSKLYIAFMSYLAFIPLEIYFYQGTSPLALVFQIILSPFTLLTACCGIIALIPVNSTTVLIGFSAKCLSEVASILGKFAFTIHADNFNLYGCFAYYSILILIVYLTFTNFQPYLKILKAVLYTSLIIYFIPINNFVTAEVSFINVGQGDACLIRQGVTTILIDTGGSIYQDLASECLIPYFRKKQIYDIDLLITTHDDFDHSGSLPSLNAQFKINKCINKAENFPISINNITFQNYNIYQDQYQEENEQSLVIGFHLINKDFLIMGDAPIEIEKEIMKDNNYIPCDILKVGHHGSKTSSSKEFINYLSPKEAIISVGKNNYYHHPNIEVINILNNANVKIRRTDKEGTISYRNFIWI